jgi:hypothetical protein
MHEEPPTGLMSTSISSLWLFPPVDMAFKIQLCVDSACDMRSSRDSGYLFFRADDIAVPGKNFARIMELFTRYRVPLSLAVVPAWLTGPRWKHLKGLSRRDPSLWCWHQHGWRHINHEPGGKKQEFGQRRTPSQIRRDLTQGKKRLEICMERDFYPVFTPPWNRCSDITLEILRELDYRAVSRDKGSLPPPPEGFDDFQVNVDLHTRKEPDPSECVNNLLTELKEGLISGSCGIMIHAQRMNEAAFSFLDILLSALTRHKKLNLVHFKDLAQHKEPDREKRQDLI